MAIFYNVVIYDPLKPIKGIKGVIRVNMKKKYPRC